MLVNLQPNYVKSDGVVMPQMLQRERWFDYSADAEEVSKRVDRLEEVGHKNFIL